MGFPNFVHVFQSYEGVIVAVIIIVLLGAV